MAKCPICGSEAANLPKTGDADGFDCPTHGRFKASGTTISTKQNAGQPEWEAALKRAKNRDSQDWPLIKSEDFDH